MQTHNRQKVRYGDMNSDATHFHRPNEKKRQTNQTLMMAVAMRMTQNETENKCKVKLPHHQCYEGKLNNMSKRPNGKWYRRER